MSALALTNITSGISCHAKFHASEASDSEEDFNIFLCISLVQTQDFLFLALAAILFIGVELF